MSTRPLRTRRLRRRALFVLLLGALAALDANVGDAQERQPTGTTASVFRRFADRVSKVQVVEKGSGAKATIGSGFFASAAGHVVTNYHVVSKLIDAPERYRAELVDSAGVIAVVRVRAIDVVNDIAILESEVRQHPYFTLSRTSVAQGVRLYALGHPEDLGLSIVEGTYNGYLAHTRQPRIHFTGAINHGMSGGPTLTEEGRVIGINVSTAGNELSFLVPVEHAAALLDSVVRRGTASGAAPTLADAGRQIRAYQDLYLRDMFADPSKQVLLGPFSAPTEPAPFFRCWADAYRRVEQPYETVYHRCSTDDDLFITGDQSSGVLELTHELITSTKLNAIRFFALYTNEFRDNSMPSGDEEHVTAWRCDARNVRRGTSTMRTVLCLRRYRKLGELYDAVLRVAMLGRANVGLVSTLTMQGVSTENAGRIAQSFAERITWR